MAVEDDEGRPASSSLEDLESAFDLVDVVGVTNSENVPSVSFEPRRDVFCERNPRVSFNGDVVVVVDPAKII
jgi:hypothetical protein